MELDNGPTSRLLLIVVCKNGKEETLPLSKLVFMKVFNDVFNELFFKKEKSLFSLKKL
jgi:hypothetical protein